MVHFFLFGYSTDNSKPSARRCSVQGLKLHFYSLYPLLGLLEHTQHALFPRALLGSMHVLPASG
jgi:hypothetical protein